MFNRAFAHRAINLTSDTWKRFYSRRASRYVFAMPRSPTSLQWLMRADEARSRADEMDDDESKLAMLEIAAGYELLAEQAASIAEAGIPVEQNEPNPLA